MNSKARVIAYYLPQYHPVPLNDEWWGKGFTEWTNVAKAKPLFKGHYQPKIPADLGFYDLRVPEVREEQARLAKESGIEGFCYWHYWLGKGKTLLDRPFNEVLSSGKPDFPFCLGWANHDWTNDLWEKTQAFSKSITYLKQTYIEEEFDDHFRSVLPAFKDHRYITVDGKPLFVIYNPFGIPAPEKFISRWQKLAIDNGLKGIHFAGIVSNLSSVNNEFGTTGKRIIISKSTPSAPIYQQVLSAGFDAINSRGLYRAEICSKGRLNKYFYSFFRRTFNINFLKVFDYKKIIKYLFVPEDKWDNVYPTILPNWDRSPRSGKKANIYNNSTPENFRIHLKDAINLIKDKQEEHKILFLMSWNEWGEGNYVEPDLKYGHGYLDVLKEELFDG